MPESPASIAAVGLALAAAPVVVEREIVAREEAAAIVLKKLRFFRDSPQGPEPDATGYKGFYYHFLDMRSGRRVWDCELSTMDTGFLLAGMLTAATYFDRENPVEHAIREIAEHLYRRVDWRWATNGGAAITHGWKPESGFIPYVYEGYDEGLLLYVLALGSPTFSLGPESYAAWTSTFQWKQVYSWEYLYSGPAVHPPALAPLRRLQGDPGPLHAFEGHRLLRELAPGHLRAARVRDPQPEPVRDVRRDLLGVHRVRWAGWMDRKVRDSTGGSSTILPVGHRSAPTTAPSPPGWWSPRCRSRPRSSCRRSRTSTNSTSGMSDSYGFKTSFNPTFEVEGRPAGWVSPHYFGIDQGPLVLMIENYRTGLLWSVMKKCPHVVEGLRGQASEAAGSEPSRPLADPGPSHRVFHARKQVGH